MAQLIGTGLLWITRENYPRFLALVDDDWIIPTHEIFAARTQEAIAFIEGKGGKPVRVEADPDYLFAWCAERGLRLDSTGRQAFAADPANWPATQKH